MAAGPTIKNVKGTVTRIVTNGTTNSFTTSGVTLRAVFSTSDPTQIAKIAGITVERYDPDDGSSNGIPKTLLRPASAKPDTEVAMSG